MMVEVSEEGIVFCNMLVCDAWIEPDNCCKGCPIDKLFTTASKRFDHGIQTFCE